MNYIDLVLGILLIAAAIRGFFKGFIIEFASLAALVLGIWGAMKFSFIASDLIVDVFRYNPKYLGIISFIITFIVIVVLIHILGKVLDKMIKAAALGFVNRLAGVFFGVVKSALILSVLLLVLDKVDENVHLLPKEQKADSRVYEPLKQLVPTIFPFIKFWEHNEKVDKEEKTDTKSEI